MGTGVQTGKAAVTSSLPVDWLALTFLGVVILFTFVLGVIQIKRDRAAARQEVDRPAFEFRSAAWRIVQSIVIVVSLVAAYWHSTLAHDASGATGPDGTTAFLILLVLAVILMPLIDKINLPGGGGIELVSQQIKAETQGQGQKYETALIGIATAARTIADAQTLLVMKLRNPAIAIADVAAFVLQTLADTTQEIAEALRPPPPPPANPLDPQIPPEKVRVTVWLAYTNKAGQDAFRCAFGWPADESSNLIGTGGAMPVGAPATIAYRISQVGNYPDLPAQQRPSLSPNRVRYRGIMMVPMFGDGKPIGVVHIEREIRQRFDPAPQSLARALAALYGSVLTDPRLA